MHTEMPQTQPRLHIIQYKFCHQVHAESCVELLLSTASVGVYIDLQTVSASGAESLCMKD